MGGWGKKETQTPEKKGDSHKGGQVLRGGIFERKGVPREGRGTKIGQLARWTLALKTRT